MFDLATPNRLPWFVTSLLLCGGFGACAYPHLQMVDTSAEGGTSQITQSQGGRNQEGSASGGAASEGGTSNGGQPSASTGGLPAGLGGTRSSGGGGTKATGGGATMGGTKATGGMTAGAGIAGRAAAGSAGKSNTTAGGNSAAGGRSATGGSSGTYAGVAGMGLSCNSATNLIANAALSPQGNWIGGDTTSRLDDPCGVQGTIYVYGDLGLDGIANSGDESVVTPAHDPNSSDPQVRLSPCAIGQCCISGKTVPFPIVSGSSDFTASVWGGGIGMNLGLLDPQSLSGTQAYSGPAIGLRIQLSGTLNGQTIRINYPQTAATLEGQIHPFVDSTNLGQHDVPFDAVSCPNWPNTVCTAPTARPYRLEVQVVGGDVAGNFTLCIDSVTPILP